MSASDRRSTVPATPQPRELAGPSWQRLSPRMIWVDLAQSALSLLPAAVAIWVGVEPGAGQLWPLIGLAVVGVVGAIGDALRWVFTRYRITPSHVELRTGVLLRKQRSIQRDRIRSVDVEGRLRHRVAGLRVVNVGAGQQNTAGESALKLDAISAPDAWTLRDQLQQAPRVVHDTATAGPGTQESTTGEPTAEDSAPAEPGPSVPPSSDPDSPIAVLARFEPGWVVYNMFNAWAYLLVLGIGWGGYWMLGSFGVDAAGIVTGLLDWEALGWAWTVAIAFGVVSVVGAVGLAVNYFIEYWNFELARVPGEKGTLLRTRQGLFTREVNRDENRVRGIQLSEPVLWRWMGATDTTLVTTGLSMWSMTQPAAVLPRGPLSVARRVADEALGSDTSPLETPLRRHHVAALRRRLCWATVVTAFVAFVLGWFAATDVLPVATLWAAAVVWPVALLAAGVAYRALGHAIRGPWLVARSGLVSRSTTALERSAVSTIVIRESLLQRRLRLRTVSAMTAAGYGGYAVPDIEAHESVAFAAEAAPGLLTPFLAGTPHGTDTSARASRGAGGVVAE